jgi:transposase
VRERTRSKNEIHAIVIRRLIGRPPASDLFGVKGRKWLTELELPVEERETLESCLRQIAFFDSEIAAVDRLIARAALASAQARRLMTVPGVNVICAATFLATIGDIGRFRSPRKLVGYLGLDPRVRRSGSGRRRTAISRGKAHGRRARRSSRRAGARSANPARFARSTSASAHAAATGSPSSRAPASWPACSGACSRASRTTPSPSPR